MRLTVAEKAEISAALSLASKGLEADIDASTTPSARPSSEWDDSAQRALSRLLRPILIMVKAPAKHF
jgi:hypothetical protein